MSTPSGSLLIEPRLHDLGDGFVVRRVLPYRLRRHVGPFVFFDHLGPAAIAPGEGLDVRPHPHIGLATVTYLYEGAIMHRDSLGNAQVIRPGDVNWMTAGRGIVHSERTPTPERVAGHRVHGIQTWVALPQADAEVEAAFFHHAASELPQIEQGDVRLRVIAGTAFGATSPVRVHAPTLYVDVEFLQDGDFVLPPEHAERAVYLVDGNAALDTQALPERTMLVLAPGGDVRIAGTAGTRLMLCGGAPLDGERHIWWNFVSSSRERIERAKADWLEQRFGQVPGETEFIPLPEH